MNMLTDIGGLFGFGSAESDLSKLTGTELDDASKRAAIASQSAARGYQGIGGLTNMASLTTSLLNYGKNRELLNAQIQAAKTANQAGQYALTKVKGANDKLASATDKVFSTTPSIG